MQVAVLETSKRCYGTTDTINMEHGAKTGIAFALFFSFFGLSRDCAWWIFGDFAESK